MRQKDNMQNPWAGLSSYEDPAKSSRKLKFCGRGSDTFDVTRLIDDNFIVTLYGKSGIGKTSLLNAGVFPALRREQYTPLSLRLGMTEEAQRFQDIITVNIERAVEEAGGSTHVIPVVDEQTDMTAIDYLWNWFACRQFLTADGQTTFPVVVFDQFEEVFRQTESRAKTEVLLSQLHYLIDESHAIGDCIVEGEEYTYDFNFRFVLSIREDDLYRLEDSIDNCALTALKRCRYRLRSLSEQGARAAILVPGEGLFHPEEQDQIVQTIIGIARNKEDQSISTNLLSLVCNRIFVDFQKKSDSDFISQSLVDTFVKGNPFERFYEEATKGFSNKEKSYIEDHLVDSTGRRNSMPESDFLLHVPKGAKLLEGDTRILQRSSVSTDGGNYRIELIHDSFCEPLSRQREKREKRKRIRQIALISITALLLISGAAYIIHSMSEREKKMLINQSRFLSEKASVLVDEGDSYLAKLLALEALPKDLNHPDRPFTIEAEIALRKAAQNNCAILRDYSWYDDYSLEWSSLSFGSYSIVSYSSNGKRIISCSNDESHRSLCSFNPFIRIWDVNTGKVIGVFMLNTKDGTSYHCTKASLSPDNRYLASFFSHKDSIIHVWDLKKVENKSYKGKFVGNITEIQSTIRHAGEIESVNFSPDGTKIVSTAKDGTLRVWDTKTGKELMRHQYRDSHKNNDGHNDYFTLASFTPDGKKIVAVSMFDDTIILLDSKTGRILKNWKSDYGISSLDISPDGKRIAVSAQGLICVWDVETCTETLHFSNPSNCAIVRFSPDGKRIACAVDNTLCVWDSETGEQLQKLEGHLDYVSSVAFSPDGKSIISASLDRTIRIWDIEKQEEPTIFLQNAKGHSICTKTANYNPDGTLIASCGYDNESNKNIFFLWNPKSYKIVKELGNCPKHLKSSDFSPDGELVAFPLEDQTIHICNVKTGATISTFSGHVNAGHLYTIDFSPDGERIVSASSDDIRVWNVKTGKELFVIYPFSNFEFTTAVFSPDGKKIVAGTTDLYNMIMIWDVNTGREYSSYNELALSQGYFDPDEKVVTKTVIDGILDYPSNEEIRLAVQRATRKEVLSATFSPDRKYFVSASKDRTVRVWDAGTGSQIQIFTFEGEEPSNASVFFSPDGRHILFAASNCDLRIWDFPPLQDLINETRKRFKDRQLTPEERTKFYLE